MFSYMVSAVIVVIGIGFVIWFLNKKLEEVKESQKADEKLLKLIETIQNGMIDQNKNLQDALRGTNRDITSVLQENTRQLNERLDKAAKIIGVVGKEVGKMAEIGRSMRELEEFLRSPKLRGNIGEQVLKEILAQTLPKQSFHLQYGFKNGQVVDAAIKTSNGIIPIDAKFPIDSFRKMMAEKEAKLKKQYERHFINDVRKHIRDIASKYILTEEGTIDYALMYIPSEAVYYEVVNHPEVFDYAHQKRVLPVSPMSFYAYIKAILMSFEGQKIEQRAREVLRALRAIQNQYNKVGDNLSVLQRHLNNAYNMMNNVLSSFMLLGQRITSTRSLQPGLGENESKKTSQQLEIE